MSDQTATTPVFSETKATPSCSCGFTAELGVVAAHYRNPIRQWLWKCFGEPASARRITAWNRHVFSHNPSHPLNLKES
jgi:hypothetical protein